MWVSQMFWTFDIFVSFITGVYVDGEIEMELSKIAPLYVIVMVFKDMDYYMPRGGRPDKFGWKLLVIPGFERIFIDFDLELTSSTNLIWVQIYPYLDAFHPYFLINSNLFQPFLSSGSGAQDHTARNPKFLKNLQINDDLDIYKNLENLFNENEKQDVDNFWNLARGSALSFIDQSWKDHLSEMDYLRSGIGLRAMGQRDPLVEYQNEGYDLFEDLINNVKFSVIRILLNFDKSLIVQKDKNIDDNVKEKVITKDKIGRNDPCYCGSGKKYKKCGLVDKCIKKS